MPGPERQAWFSLAVVGLTLAVYIVIVALFGFTQADIAAFGISGLLGIRPKTTADPTTVQYDERDSSIERSALLASLKSFYAGAMLAGLGIGFWKGWSAPFPMWAIFQILWAGLLAVWGVKALATIVLYRRSADA